MNTPWDDLAHGAGNRQAEVFSTLAAVASGAWREARHGDLPRWRAALANLPRASQRLDLDRRAPRLGAPVEDPRSLAATLDELHPWRKGPLCLGGVSIDAEWRSDLKWGRLSPHLDFEGASVLDVGCGNGYFGWRMLGAGARRVVGIDPTWLFVMQWVASRHFAGPLPNHVLPLRFEDLPSPTAVFDAVLSMGVLYHRRDPVDHLAALRRWCRPGGHVVVETLVLPGQGEAVLAPEGRYARMRNVHAVPEQGALMAWVSNAGLTETRIVDVTATTPAEQRRTPWMRFDSFERQVDRNNPAKTIEGHPAPLRAMMIARA